MRDAFGGVFMMRLFLVFIVIYVGFTALSLNYAKAYRVKNNVISFIEEKEITDLKSFFSQGSGKRVKQLNGTILSADYNKVCNNGNGPINTGPGGHQVYCYNGVVIEETKKTSRAITYTVHTFAGWNLGSLNALASLFGGDPDSQGVLNGIWEITGEAVVRIRN